MTIVDTTVRKCLYPGIERLCSPWDRIMTRNSNLCHFRIRSLADDRVQALLIITNPGRGMVWDWASEIVADSHSCEKHEIDLVEHEDHGDLITVRGVPVARITA